ncbi:DUF3291 domain-containing protein [Marinobacterium aestuariivivens]|uniref:DUF3291 domain-containing protein n=1 Tax=Marinobacterium aestuariivivens TaxID=1698799 RepID=A0ABW2A008_9GAMM
MSRYQLAQLNIARMKYPLESPEMADFVANLERINALADTSPGFVWRLQGKEGDATSLRFFGDDVLVNMSVWEDVEALHAYAYRSAHAGIMRRRREWFERMESVYTVLWWIPAGHRPTPEEASAKLALLHEEGPTAAAFTFKQAFAAPGTPCPA